jgi:hypothetical protein
MRHAQCTDDLCHLVLPLRFPGYEFWFHREPDFRQFSKA